LYINHHFGVADPQTGDENLWLARCFNEECLARDSSLREQLFFELLAGRPLSSSLLRQGKAQTLLKAELPGNVCYLDQLGEFHDAVVYLRSRGFDPYVLGKQWQVAYCYQSSIPLVSGRIIIPVFSYGELVGWLARQSSDVVQYFPGTNRKVPKYYNMPGFQRRLHAFNFDTASQFKTIILVEGAFDAIRTGTNAVGILGKSLSSEMRQRVITAARRNGADATIVVMLDPDQDKREELLQETHHIRRLAAQLREGWTRVVEVYLPAGQDPASMTPEALQYYIGEAASCSGITLNWQQAVQRPKAARIIYT
jgi:hypothetical protein